MDHDVIATHLENLDRRLASVEQILPTLATKDEIRVLATNEELSGAVARLATKEELRAEHDRLRLDVRILLKHQDSKLQVIAEHVLSLMSRPRNL